MKPLIDWTVINKYCEEASAIFVELYEVYMKSYIFISCIKLCYSNQSSTGGSLAYIMLCAV